MHDSLSRRSFISALRDLTRALSPDCTASFSASTSNLLIRFNSDLTFPKWTLLQCFNSFQHFSIFWTTLVFGSRQSWDDQTASTTSMHPLSGNHISMKRNGLAIQGSSKLFGMIHKWLWLEEITDKWWTLEFANLSIHSLLARALFNLSQIKWPSVKCFCHVNCEPTNPRSIKPHSSTASLSSCICAWLLLLPPIFSKHFRVSLKSPAHTHGRLKRLLCCCNKFCDSNLLCVMGSP